MFAALSSSTRAFESLVEIELAKLEAEQLVPWALLDKQLQSHRRSEMLPPPSIDSGRLRHVSCREFVSPARIVEALFDGAPELAAVFCGVTTFKVQASWRNVISAVTLYAFFERQEMQYGADYFKRFVLDAKPERTDERLRRVLQCCLGGPCFHALESPMLLTLSAELLQKHWGWSFCNGLPVRPGREHGHDECETPCVIATLAALGNVPESALTAELWPERIKPFGRWRRTCV